MSFPEYLADTADRDVLEVSAILCDAATPPARVRDLTDAVLARLDPLTSRPQGRAYSRQQPLRESLQVTGTWLSRLGLPTYTVDAAIRFLARATDVDHQDDVQRGAEQMYRQALGHPNASSDLLRDQILWILGRRDADSRPWRLHHTKALWKAMNNPSCPQDIVFDVCGHRDQRVREVAALSARCPSEGKAMAGLLGINLAYPPAGAR